MALGSFDPNSFQQASLYDPQSLINASASWSDANYQFSDFLNNLFKQTAQLDSDATLQADRAQSALRRRVQQLYQGFTRNVQGISEDFANRGMLYSGAHLREQADNGQAYVTSVGDSEISTQQYLEDLQRNILDRKNAMEEARRQAEMQRAAQEQQYKLQQAQMQAWMDAQERAGQARDQQMQQMLQQQQQANQNLQQTLAGLRAQQQPPPQIGYPGGSVGGGAGSGSGGAMISPVGGASGFFGNTGGAAPAAGPPITANPNAPGGNITGPAPQQQQQQQQQPPQQSNPTPITNVVVPPPPGSTWDPVENRWVAPGQAVNPPATSSYPGPSQPPAAQPPAQTQPPDFNSFDPATWGPNALFGY